MGRCTGQNIWHRDLLDIVWDKAELMPFEVSARADIRHELGSPDGAIRVQVKLGASPRWLKENQPSQTALCSCSDTAHPSHPIWSSG